jgi:dsRNA-specific ribonuclease
MDINIILTMNTKTLLQDGDISKGAKDDEELIFDPYNPNNKEITQRQVEIFLKRYGVPDKVHNLNLYKRAFVHRSYVKRPHLENMARGITLVGQPDKCLALKTKSNERLEFLGDGVLELITKYYLYRRFPKENEGFMTEKKIALVKNESIGKMAYEMGLNHWYVLSKNAEEKKTRTNLKKLGCLFEAFLGALFLDFNKITILDEKDWFKNVFVTGPGFQIAQIFVETIFDKHVDWIKLLQTDDNYKNILQVKIQKEFKVTPIYLTISNSMEEGYKMGVYLCLGEVPYKLIHAQSKPFSYYGSFENIHKGYNEGKFIFIFLGKGLHKIKKKAEQTACENALKIIG